MKKFAETAVFRQRIRIHLTVILSILFLFQMENTFAQPVKLSLDVKERPLADVFKLIKNQTQMSVVYNVNDIDPGKKVTVSVQNEDLSVLLEQVLKGTNLGYAIDRNYIVLFANGRTETPGSVALNENEPLTVKGKVSDETGEPLIGANVMVNGKSTGTVTDIDGNYSLTLPAGSSSLHFSYIGYLPQIISINRRTQIDAILAEDSKTLDEVVVTAMGITREAKTLTYAAQTVKSEELTRAKDANFINSLQGKSAGLIITPSAGGAGSASKILLRGNTSILGENTPLIVIDGIPMQNKVQGKFDSASGGYNMAYSARSEGSDALSGINPEDIESMTILKGANAAALYGFAAGNGVIIISTKKGSAGKVKIDFSGSASFESPLILPKLQNHFGAVIKSDSTLTASSWGKPIGELTAGERNIDGVTGKTHDIADFFRTGTSFNNTIAISGGSENIQNYFSYGNTNASGIIPHNRFDRHALTFRQTYNLLGNDRLKVELSANYVQQTGKNKISGGTVYNPLYNLYLAPRNLDMKRYKNYESHGSWLSEPVQVLNVSGTDIGSHPETVTLEGMKQNWFLGRGSSGENNPYWLINRSRNESVSRHFWGSIDVKYNILNDLSLRGRFKYDRTETRGSEVKYATTVAREGSLIDRGESDYLNGTYFDLFTDFMLTYNRKINDFSLFANLGASLNIRKGEDLWMRNGGPSDRPYYTKKEDIPLTINYFYPDASITTDRSFTPESDWDKAIFATATVGYREIAYLDATYRIDWTRTYTQFKHLSLQKVRPCFDYYSIGGNILLNRAVDLGEQIDLLKLRLSHSLVGNSLPNKRLNAAMQKRTKTGSVLAVDVSGFNPKPEMTRSTEAGIDLALFRNTVDFNFTFYNAVSLNQYLEFTSSLGQVKPVSSGKIRNRGIETNLAYNFMPSRLFYWKTGFNFSYNDNKIISTSEHRTDLSIKIGTSDNLRVRFIEGRSYGDLYAKDFLRYSKFDEEAGLGKEGDINLGLQGTPSLDARGGHNLYLGNINSKIRMGWHNTLNYKDWSLYFLIDGKVGGKVISFTEAYLDARGVSKRSADARLSGKLWTDGNGNRVPAVVMPDGNLASAQKYYETIGSQIFPSRYVFNATNFRLRELSIGYTFNNLPSFIRSANLSLTARNLFFLYNRAPVDPDVSQSTANGLGGVDIFTLPATRSYGLNIKLTF
ncbi:MAG: SusC/RagA family TonB-linked outer membrane protein [Candidatus Symbiothrix sp.]|nr:SusC/RagA family TonB-linked outer membrane protein [Candidatus Symbiothrix sp.]